MVEQRRNKRFEIRLPVRLVRNGMRALSATGQTRNLSSGGVLFSTDTRIDVGEPIEYIISLEGPVTLHCLGKVTRLDTANDEWQDPDLPFQVAATMERYEFVRGKA